MEDIGENFSVIEEESGEPEMDLRDFIDQAYIIYIYRPIWSIYLWPISLWPI